MRRIVPQVVSQIGSQLLPDTPVTRDGPVFGGFEPASEGGWNPTNITTGTVRLWLNPEAGVTMDGSNRVSLWEDQSASGIDFEQATDGNKFVYNATALNGTPGLRCEPAKNMASTSSFGFTGGRYIFAVIKNDADLPASVNGAWVMDSVNYGTLLPFLNGTIYDGFGRNAGQTVGDPGASMAVPCVYTVYTNTSVFTAWLDGVQISTTGSPAGSLAWPATLYLGGNGFGSFAGEFGDIIVIDSGAGALSNDDYDYILDGLMAKAGI